MISTLLALTLPPWVRMVVVPLAIAVAIVGAYLWTYGRGYDAGFAASEAAVTIASAKHAETVLHANAEIAGVRAAAAAQIAEAKAARPQVIVRTREALSHAPDYAATRRPDAVHAERVQQLDALATAAADRDLR
jgi:hypothetical protein